MTAVMFESEETLLTSAGVDGSLYAAAQRQSRGLRGRVRLQNSRGIHARVTDDAKLSEVLRNNGPCGSTPHGSPTC